MFPYLYYSAHIKSKEKVVKENPDRKKNKNKKKQVEQHLDNIILHYFDYFDYIFTFNQWSIKKFSKITEICQGNNNFCV